MDNFAIIEQALTLDGTSLFSGLDNAVLLPDPNGVGSFIKLKSAAPASTKIISLGRLNDVAKWSACHRYEPFWMTAKAGTLVSDIPAETQFLMTELTSGVSVILVPLIDAPFRCALQGGAGETLEIVAETGDSETTGSDFTALFVATGQDPFELVRQGARSVAAFFGPKRLRIQKPMPAWLDTFGWCTWDAFYQDVTHDKVRLGLESFANGGITPKLLILDDGWQTVDKKETGETQLTAFPANSKFPGDLAPTVRMAKEEFGITNLLVWHAMNGYWGGVDPAAFPAYEIHTGKRSLSPGILTHIAELSYWGTSVGVVSPADIEQFFDDYHTHLVTQGVDGVKVDTQATLECVAEGIGGRVSLMAAYRKALEKSVLKHFNGSLINCMSCANEMLYGALDSTVTRTSTDFWPDVPESHGLHLYVNAQVSLWFGEFVQPDWDMFQSGHMAGPYHAAGRVVGGSSIYVSDKPGKHNFDLLKKLVLSDGSVLRADAPGRPTRDCVYHDCTREDVLLKIFNTSGGTGIVGAFNALKALDTSVKGSISPSDVAGLEGDTFAVYAHTTNELRLMNRSGCWNLTLPSLGFELFTIVPIADDFAAIGNPEMYLSAGALLPGATSTEIHLKTGGLFLAWSKKVPTKIEANGKQAKFSYNSSTGRLDVDINDDTPTTLSISY